MTKDRVSVLILLIFCAFFYYQTYQIPDKGFTGLDAAFFPRIILGLIAVLAVFMMVRSLSSSYKERKNVQEKGRTEQENQKGWKVWTIFALFGLFILSTTILGFIISSFCFMIVVYFIVLSRERTLKQHILTMVSLLVVSYVLAFIFRNYLNVLLPQGIFF